jgi:hypothetical protein
MTLEEKAGEFLKNSGNYDVFKTDISTHIQWSVVNLPLDPNTHNFAKFYSDESLLDLAISVGFNTNG